jgi:hypothetical protein
MVPKLHGQSKRLRSTAEFIERRETVLFTRRDRRASFEHDRDVALVRLCGYAFSQYA